MAILSLLTFTFVFPLGLSYTISGMVGSFIGQHKFKEAIRYAKVGYVYGMLLTVIICVLAGSQHSFITRMFNGDAAQQKKLNHCMIVIFMIIMLQSSYGILVGVAKGLGLQYITSLITTLCYFAIALTLAEFMGSSFVSFFKLEGTKYLSQIQGPLGFNIGFMIGLLVLNVGLFQMLATVSWDKICQDLTAYHNLVNEMSFRKQIYHMHISRSNYNPTLPT